MHAGEDTVQLGLPSPGTSRRLRPPEERIVADRTALVGGGTKQAFIFSTTWLRSLGEHVIDLARLSDGATDSPPDESFSVTVTVREVVVTLLEADADAIRAVPAGTPFEIALPTDSASGDEWVVTRQSPFLDIPGERIGPDRRAPVAGGEMHVLRFPTDSAMSSAGTLEVVLAYKNPASERPMKTLRFRIRVTLPAGAPTL